MSIKKQLFDKAQDSLKRQREAEGHSGDVPAECEALAEEYCSDVFARASRGELKVSFEMQGHSMETIKVVSILMKEKLGDVLISFSPRGIEANWKMND